MAQIRLRRTTIALALGLLLAFTTCFPECRKAQPEDAPQGANELIELARQRVDNLSGTVMFPNEEPAGDVVVEVYRHSGKLQSPVTVQPPRLAACITGDDGKFSFVGLKPGKYLLRVGTRKFAGINEMRVPIILKKSLRQRRRPALNLKLALGT